MRTSIQKTAWVGIAAMVAVVAWLVAGIASAPKAYAQMVLDKPGDSAKGKETFQSTCAACHGLDGKSGERGPDISSTARVQKMSDAELLKIIHDGKQGTEMPGFAFLGDDKLKEVLRHLRFLQGVREKEKAPGDAAAGRLLFFGKAECSQCHAVQGAGGFLGSELTVYGKDRPVEVIRRAILAPNEDLDPRKRALTVTLANGRKYTGIARSDDNFSVVLQTEDGAFHSLKKSQLKSFEYLPTTLMPADYEKRLTSKEIDDLISFLMSSAEKPGNKPAGGGPDGENGDE